MLIRIFICNLELLARIGIHGHEQGTPQPIRINVELETDVTIDNDRLDGVVDYEAVANNIRAIVAAGHVNLAETLAQRIATSCLEDGRVLSARVRVDKLQALVGAHAAAVQVELKRN